MVPIWPPQVPSSPLAILSSNVLTMMPSGSEVASRAISFRTVLKNFLASGGWNSIFLKEWFAARRDNSQALTRSPSAPDKPTLPWSMAWTAAAWETLDGEGTQVLSLRAGWGLRVQK